MYKKAILVALILFTTLSCGNDDDSKDTEYPVIDMSGNNGSPKNCTVVYRGESFTFKAKLTDNEELGSYNIEIHNNFDHHSHSTDGEECELEPKKTPIKAFVFNSDFTIPNGQRIFEAENEIVVPSDIDTGDYHFMIRLTDKTGWQQLKALSIKIEDRK